MTNKQCQIRLTSDDLAKIEVIRDWLGGATKSGAVRHAIEIKYREILRENARAEEEEARYNQSEARYNYSKGLGLP